MAIGIINMFNRIFQIFLLLNIANYLNVTYGFMDLKEYYKMPPLYALDDYDRCLNEEPTSTYCLARAQIQPNYNSTLWKQIETFSKERNRHFQHDQLYFGICINWCEKQLKLLNITDNEYYRGIWTNNSELNLFLDVFAKEEINRNKYNKIINQCINYKLRNDYDLEALSNIEYCNTNNNQINVNQSNGFDIWNLFFLLFLAIIVAATILSTIYDAFKKSESETTDRKVFHNGKWSSLLVSFSIQRNYKRLTLDRDLQLSQDLKFLDCFKFFLVFGVIMIHTGWVVIQSPVYNPQHFEILLESVGSVIQGNGSIMVVTFFVISGFLLTIIFNKEIVGNENRNFFGLFGQILVLRYFRLTTMYGFMILLHGYMFEGYGGPIWRHLFEREQWVCRKNWWTNLLYINNYVNVNEQCIVQAWYLATDTQVFIISLIILMVITKRTKLTIPLLGIFSILAFLIPTAIVYFYKLDGIFLSGLKDLKDIFFDMASYKHYYIPAETNIGPSIFGMIAGLFYIFMMKMNYDLKKYKSFIALWYLCYPLGICLFLSGYIFISNDFEKPSFWIAIYGGFHRNIWAIGCAIIILGMTFGIGGILRKFSCHPVFRVLGRISFGAYMSHFFIIRLALGSMRQPLFVNDFIMFVYIFGITVFSYIMGVILTFIIELPTSAALKFIIERLR